MTSQEFNKVLTISKKWLGIFQLSSNKNDRITLIIFQTLNLYILKPIIIWVLRLLLHDPIFKVAHIPIYGIEKARF